MGNASSELQHIANALSGMAADEKRFVEAVYEGKHVVVRDILMANPNVIFARTKEWQNAWHIAAHSGSLEMLEVLHRHGRGATRKPLPGEPAPVNNKTKKGMTPLMVAVQEGREQVMQFLLAVGAEMRARDIYGNTCVHYAALQGHVKILELLLGTADAEEEGQGEQGPAAVQQLQQLGAAARILGAGAASQLGVDGLQALLAKGRFVDFRNEAGLQPLHFAVWGGHKEAAQVLFSYRAVGTERSGTDSVAEVTCNGGSTPLHIAGLRNNVAMVQYLLEQHVKSVAASNPSNPPTDPRTIKDNYGFNPHQLAKNLHREEVLALLDPRGPLPTIEHIRSTATVSRQVSVRKTPGFTRTSDTSGSAGAIARSSGDGAAPPGASAGAAGSSSEAWDPFGTAAATAVPALPPPPLPKRASAGGAASPAKPPPALRPPPAAAGLPPKHLPPPPPAAAAVSSSSAAAAAAAAPVPPPREFICPITNLVMDEPVTAADGRRYERTAIEMWLDIGNTDFPGGEVKVSSTALTPDEQLRLRITEWKKAQPGAHK